MIPEIGALKGVGSFDTGESVHAVLERAGVRYHLKVVDKGCELYVSAIGPKGLEVRRVFGMTGKDPFGTPYEPPEAT